jgi:hypothetical protein
LANLSIAADAALRAGSSAAAQLLAERAALIRDLHDGIVRGDKPVRTAMPVPAAAEPGPEPAPAPAVPSATWPYAPPTSRPDPYPQFAHPSAGGPVAPYPAGQYAAGRYAGGPYAPAAPKPPSQWTPTTALALIGALLLAAAALGYAFFIPDLSLAARVVALAFGTVVAAAGALFLRGRKLTATGEAMAAVTAALALLTWATAVGEVELDQSRAAWSGVTLAALGALMYVAGRSRLRAWRVAGLLMTPFAALYLPGLFGSASEWWAGQWAFAWIGLTLLAALGRKIESARVERVLLELLGGLGLVVAIGLGFYLGTDNGWVVWLAVAVAAAALGQEHRVAWLTVAGAALVGAGTTFVAGLAHWPSVEVWPTGLFGGLAVWTLVAALSWFPWPRPSRLGVPQGRFSGLGGSLGSVAGGAIAAMLALSVPALIARVLEVVFSPTGRQAAYDWSGWPEVVTAAEALSWAVPALAVALTAVARSVPWLRRVGDWTVVPLGTAFLMSGVTIPSVPVGVEFAVLVTWSLGLSGVAAGAVMAPGRRPRLSRAIRLTARVCALAVLEPAFVVATQEPNLMALAAVAIPAAILAVGLSLRPTSWPFLTGVACLPFIALGGMAIDTFLDGVSPLHLLTVFFCLLAAVLALVRRPAAPSWAVLAAVAVGFFGATSVSLLFDRTWTGFAASASQAILALVVALAARRPLPLAVKLAAAALAVVSTASTLVVLLALVTPGSGSVWLFPLVAVVAAVAALGGLWIGRSPEGSSADGRGATAQGDPVAPDGSAARDGSAPHGGRAADGGSATHGDRVAPDGSAARGGPVADGRPLAHRGPVAGTLMATAAALGFVTVVMAVVWPISGATTVLATAAILTAASACVALAPSGTEQAWWYTGGMACVVLWSALVWGGIGLVEAYTLPPALAAAAIGGSMMRRRPALAALTIPGAWLAVAPSLILLLAGTEPVLRGMELLALGVMALTLATAFDHLRRVIAPVALGSAAGVTALALQIGQLPPFGDGFEAFVPLRPYPSALFALAALTGLAAAAGVVAVSRLVWRGRAAGRAWLLVALALAALTPICSMRFTWPVVAGMWVAMAAYLALAIWAARSHGGPAADGAVDQPPSVLDDRGRNAVPGQGLVAGLGRRGDVLPPFWAIWLIAVAAGIAGWSTRQLRVEVFAIPLGLGLFAAGLIAKRWLGSAAWAVTPGVAATLGPSTLAVGTDPLTWRAIMVLALALGFMILGALRRWRPPTFVGAASIVVALAEVFIRNGDIDAVPWLLALLAAGGCLLALAMYFELRSRRAAAAETARADPAASPISRHSSPPNLRP